MSSATLPSFHLPAIYDVCALGNAMVDIIAECDDAFLEALGITKGAMTLIDEEKADFLYKKIGPAVEMSGGSAANTAAGVASLGGKPAYIGRVKDDQFGTVFHHDLNAGGVHFSTSFAKEGPATGRCIILVTRDAQRSMSTYLGAAAEFSSKDIDPKVIENAHVTYLEGYLFDKPEAQEAFYLASRIAHKAKRLVAMTLSDTFCVERHRGDFLALVKDGVDILVANEHELMALYQTQTFEQALAAARDQVKIVVGTRSEKGASLASASEVVSIPAERVEQVVDTTGAGDLFASGFLFGLTRGCNLTTSGALGVMTAAEVISHYGPRPKRSLKELIREKGVAI